jgi:hypothetical protein
LGGRLENPLTYRAPGEPFDLTPPRFSPSEGEALVTFDWQTRRQHAPPNGPTPARAPTQESVPYSWIESQRGGFTDARANRSGAERAVGGSGVDMVDQFLANATPEHAVRQCAQCSAA